MEMCQDAKIFTLKFTVRNNFLVLGTIKMSTSGQLGGGTWLGLMADGLMSLYRHSCFKVRDQLKKLSSRKIISG